MTQPDQSGADQSRADDVDLSSVDPRRWPEIRRRVAILREYVAIDEPTGDTTALFAARMGVRISNFYALAKIWRESRDATKLYGARGVRQRTRARNETRDVPKESLAVISAVIDDLGVWARDRAIHEEIGRRLADGGLDPVSTGTIRLMILKARSSTTEPSNLKPAVLIERCRLKLPLADGGVAVMPDAVVAVAVPENTIISWRSGTPNDPPSVTAVVDDVVALGVDGAPPRPLAGPRLGPDDLARIAYPVDRTSRRLRLRMAIGADLGGIAFVTQSPKPGSAAGLLGGRLDRLLNRDDVDAAIAAAAARHNAGRGGVPAYSVATSIASA